MCFICYSRAYLFCFRRISYLYESSCAHFSDNVAETAPNNFSICHTSNVQNESITSVSRFRSVRFFSRKKKFELKFVLRFWNRLFILMICLPFSRCVSHLFLRDIHSKSNQMKWNPPDEQHTDNYGFFALIIFVCRIDIVPTKLLYGFNCWTNSSTLSSYLHSIWSRTDFYSRKRISIINWINDFIINGKLLISFLMHSGAYCLICINWKW